MSRNFCQFPVADCFVGSLLHVSAHIASDIDIVHRQMSDEKKPIHKIVFQRGPSASMLQEEYIHPSDDRWQGVYRDSPRPLMRAWTLPRKVAAAPPMKKSAAIAVPQRPRKTQEAAEDATSTSYSSTWPRVRSAPPRTAKSHSTDTAQLVKKEQTQEQHQEKPEIEDFIARDQAQTGRTACGKQTGA